MVLRKVVAFIGLLGVISALAWQHGLFDRADAASPEPSQPAVAAPTAQPETQPASPAQASTKVRGKTASNRSHPKR